MKRREFLKLGAVATGTFAVAGTLRVGGRAALAQSGAVPAVDRLVMTNVVDNVYDIFAKGGKLDTISVQRTPLERGGTLLAEHGLAYHLESLRGSERREILLDFSLTERNLLNNYAVLKVDPSRADALILSHGHRDHYGALPDLARLAQGKLRPGLTLHAGGEDTFCHRVVVTPVGTVDGGQLDRGALEARGLRVVLSKDPTVVAGHAFITDFERPPAAARLEAGPMGSACSVTHFGATQVEAKPGELVHDTFQGEHATAYHVRDRGLVVITSCGHAGVINSVRQAQKASGVSKVHAIVGGFHLAPAPDEIVAKTVEAFKAIGEGASVRRSDAGLQLRGRGQGRRGGDGEGRGASLSQLDPRDALHPNADLLNPRKGLQGLVNTPTRRRVNLVGQEPGLFHDGRQRIVDLGRGRGGEAGDVPEDVPCSDDRFGLLSVRDVTGDRRRPDDPPLPVPDRRHGDAHVDAPPVLPHPYGLVVVDPFTTSNQLEDLRQLVPLDDDPHRRPPEDLAGRVPVEPLGASVPARDHAVECLADDRVVQRLHDRSGEGQRRFGRALLDNGATGSAIIATVPVKACDSPFWVSRAKGPTPRNVPRVAIGRRTLPHVLKDGPTQVLMSGQNCSRLALYGGAGFCSTATTDSWY